MTRPLRETDVNALSPRQLALAGEYVKEGYPVEDAIRMAHEAGDPRTRIDIDFVSTTPKQGTVMTSCPKLP